ncbi:MAG TPA: SURF1 family protein [Actinomycetota bacterium]|nr:SURF1 family protein [Actinomycetota bacterium]
MSVRKRHIILIAIAAIVAFTCVRLGLWQLNRLHGRRDVNAMLEARGAEAPAPITSLPSDAMPYRHVTVTGTYDPAHEQILSGRTSDQGDPGNHVLTPLVLDNGSAVIVDRGWVPLEAQTPPIGGAAAAPTGTVTVTGLALPPDQVSDPPVDPSPPLVTRIDLGRGDLPYKLLPVYILLQGQQPAQAQPETVAPPGFDDGPHLSYAIQWFSFATIAVVGCVVLLVRDRRGNSDEPTAVP